MDKLYSITCPKCHHTWLPRVPHPNKCPKCGKQLAGLSPSPQAMR